MKFLYSDTQDYVDPAYDFINDRNAPKRERYWDDVYAHEMMDPTPYDGLLVAMSAVRQAKGVPSSKVRYSTKEEQRLLRDGARKFLRFQGEKFDNLMLMGDCGAFAYVKHDTPAYLPSEVVDFYIDAGFSHGVSPDHIIFECDLSNPSLETMAPDVRQRYDVTLTNAAEFLRLAKDADQPFEPMGAVQGWSPKSMAAAAVQLEQMGYRYLAIGGLVPLKADAIHEVLKQIRNSIKPETSIHLLGFAKADHIQQFTGYSITSFDSTSPLIRAFKDEKHNYYLDHPDGGLEYFTAIRIPQAMENTRLVQGIKRGIFSAEDLHTREQRALRALREFDKGSGSMLTTLNAVMDYHKFLVLGNEDGTEKNEKVLDQTRERIRRTLDATPWKRCDCDVCRSIGVEVIIFRSSNRNKRRGFHNLGVYHKHVRKTLENAR